MKTRPVRSMAVVAVAAALCIPASAIGDPPIAHQALQCGTISTSNGGEARFINTYRVKCSSAKKIARKAKGKAYKALDKKFTCKPKQTSGISGLSYFCKTKGTTRSLGFIYRAP